MEFMGTYIDPALVEKVTDAVLNVLYETYEVNGEQIQGNSFSFVMQNAVRRTVRGIGHDGLEFLEWLGFRVVEVPHKTDPRKAPSMRIITV